MSGSTAKMAASIMGKKRSYPGDSPAEEAGEPKNEVEADEMDKGDFEGMSINKAANGYSVHVRGKAPKGDMAATNSQEYVFSHDHPVAQHLHSILKHAKKK